MGRFEWVLTPRASGNIGFGIYQTESTQSENQLAKMFLSKNVSYLGFRLTEEGIAPRKDKLKVVLGLSQQNHYKKFIHFLTIAIFLNAFEEFSQVSSPMTCLTKKECPWK
jgi:hypothetical protein